MPALVTMVLGWLALIVKGLGAKALLLATVIAVVTGVIITTKVGMELLVDAIPSSPLPSDMNSALGALLPSATRTCLELLIQARIAVMVFQSKWLYLRMYMWAAGWKFI